MMKTHSDFVHLHNHTEYSLLDGANRIEPLLQKAKRFGMPALAITDHGNLFGAITFYEKAMALGIKPIIGCETYIAPQSRFEKKSAGGVKEACYHLPLLARNHEGYANLMALSSLGYLQGFYYRPRIDKELLAKHGAGLIGLSGCLAGEVPQMVLRGDEGGAKKAAGEYAEIFGKFHYYLELQSHGIEDQLKVNKVLVKMAKELNLPLVCTNDCHYLERDDAKWHDILLCLQTGKTLANPDRMKYPTDEFYFKSPEEMKLLFKDHLEAVKSTITIAEACNLEIQFETLHLPKFPLPKGYDTLDDYLAAQCREGLKKRYENITPELKQRLEYELEIIKKLNFSGYFLIVWDFISMSKSHGIDVGPGRGSAVGSLVSYTLGITNIDPIRYGLFFERFLNPERVSMPDIDIDFRDDRRAEVVKYMTEKYGKENVAQIITFGSIKAKAAIRDVGRVMGFSYGDGDRIAKMIPNELDMTLEKALDSSPELRGLVESDPKVKELFEAASKVEGMARHASTHAAGVVIAAEGLVKHTPVYKDANGETVITQYDMRSLERVGLLKLDILGLKTLTAIQETLGRVKRRKGIDVDIDRLPDNDPKTYEMLCKGQAIGLFQLESGGMRDLLKRLKPQSIFDVMALIALYRPGPMQMIDEFVKRKHGLIPIKYEHPILEETLKETYGTIVYQEQVMQVAVKMAGFTMGQADLLRRAMAKKKAEVMEKQREVFAKGAAKNKIPQATAEKIFDLLAKFAEYGFNKSHSAAYAHIAYQTAYLKAHFPTEYMAALLTSEIGGHVDKIVMYVAEAGRMGIKVLPPDINESDRDFTEVDESVDSPRAEPVVPLRSTFAEASADTRRSAFLPGHSPELPARRRVIRFGLAAVKNVGEGAIESIVEMRRQKGPFKSLEDFCLRVDARALNRKVLESLIKCGACDSFKLHRSQLITMIGACLENAQAMNRDRANGQTSLFGSGETASLLASVEIPDLDEYPENSLLQFEKELLGLYVSGHPLSSLATELKIFATSDIQGLMEKQDGDRVIVGGLVGGLQLKTTKRGDRMGIARIEDLTGATEVVIFPRVFDQYVEMLRKESIFLVEGRVDLSRDQPKILADRFIPLEQAAEVLSTEVHVKVAATGQEEPVLDLLKKAFEQFPGSSPTYVHFQKSPEEEVGVIETPHRVKASKAFMDTVHEVAGEDSVWLQVVRSRSS